MPNRSLATRLILITALASISLYGQSLPALLKSPGGELAISFDISHHSSSDSGQLVYSVTYHGKPLLTESRLQLELAGARPLGANVHVIKQTASQIDDTYQLVTGKARVVRDHYNVLRLETEEPAGLQRRLEIDARAYDDAIAFRYVVPDQRLIRDFRLTRENTEFRISKDVTTYALVLPHFHTMYESEFLKLPASAFANANGLSRKVLIGMPLLMKVPGVAWMAIAEADMRGYSAMYLVNPSTDWGGHYFESQLAPGDDPDISRLRIPPAQLTLARIAGG